MSENKQALQVAALKNGTVIDHIPSEKLFTVVQLLGVEQMTSNITIGFNLDSKKLGKKGITKVGIKNLSRKLFGINFLLFHSSQRTAPDRPDFRGEIGCKDRKSFG